MLDLNNYLTDGQIIAILFVLISFQSVLALSAFIRLHKTIKSLDVVLAEHHKEVKNEIK